MFLVRKTRLLLKRSETRLNLHEYVVTAYNNNRINLWLVIIKDYNQVIHRIKGKNFKNNNLYKKIK
jgi:site-specific DNA-adenine methylase